MKVGLVRRGYSPVGGAEAYLKRLATALVELGHEVTLFASPDWPASDWKHGEIVAIQGNRASVFADHFQSIPKKIDTLLSLERIWSCDVYRAGDGVHASWLNRRTHFELPWKKYLRWFNRKHTELLTLEAAVFNPLNTRRIIANSQLVASEIETFYAYPKSRIDIIRNGLESAAFAPLPDRELARRQWQLPQDAKVALFAGSGWERKGLHFAMSAVERVPWMTLLVAGRGRLPKHIPPNVRFVGAQKSLLSLFSAADLFILPTLYDPLSNACLEAFAAGLPVITTKANGFSELLKLGENGEAIDDPSKIEVLADILKEWGSPGRIHPQLRSEIRQQAQAYTIEENTRQTLATLNAARQP